MPIRKITPVNIMFCRNLAGLLVYRVRMEVGLKPGVEELGCEDIVRTGRDGDGNLPNETGREREKVPSRLERTGYLPVKYLLFRCFSHGKVTGNGSISHSPSVRQPIFWDGEMAQTLSSHTVSCPLDED